MVSDSISGPSSSRALDTSPAPLETSPPPAPSCPSETSPPPAPNCPSELEVGSHQRSVRDGTMRESSLREPSIRELSGGDGLSSPCVSLYMGEIEPCPLDPANCYSPSRGSWEGSARGSGASDPESVPENSEDTAGLIPESSPPAHPKGHSSQFRNNGRRSRPPPALLRD
eukprot:CAMPEP_0197844724 /NCGR_PEP_ID=MMETSP1438-20131217/1704_1 /TAXON_ID=1461541 /ORGANISM="Pterosperma sp., Strain CCMP1384" /LENGTH=169 /DNA_ID=CAMNT_0043455669 /DNA_START=203 /DNA_END=712 /DNA_ORIENTATION=+